MSDHTIVVIWAIRSLLYSSSMYSGHLLISSVFFNSIPFLSFIMPFAWKCSLGVSNFLKETYSLPYSLFSISLHWSLRKAFLSLFAILWNSPFRWIYLSFSSLPFASLLFSAICKAFSDKHFAFLHLFFLGMVLITASYTMLWTSIHSSSDTLSNLILWMYLSLPLYKHERFDSGYTWMVF